MTTAYEASTGYIYLYSTYNSTPGGISMMKVKPDNTSADGAELIELYDAAGFAQYCITSLICGPDGTIYYKNDSGNVLAVGVPQAEGVMKLIDAIGTVTAESGNVITIARNAYDALPDAEKPDVTNYGVLTAAETALRSFFQGKAEALIAAIGTVTLESENAIAEARAAYDALTAEQQKTVRNYQVLFDAEKKLAELKAADESQISSQPESSSAPDSPAPDAATPGDSKPDTSAPDTGAHGSGSVWMLLFFIACGMMSVWFIKRRQTEEE